jgi:hypothetical protein
MIEWMDDGNIGEDPASSFEGRQQFRTNVKFKMNISGWLKGNQKGDLYS